jgi:hypothetical protein
MYLEVSSRLTARDYTHEERENNESQHCPLSNPKPSNLDYVFSAFFLIILSRVAIAFFWLMLMR